MRLEEEQRIQNIRERLTVVQKQQEILKLNNEYADGENPRPKPTSGDSLGAATATPNGTPTF